MGIVLNALVIAIGGLIGSRLRKGISGDNFQTLGISIVIVSLVGFFENVYNIDGGKLASGGLILVLVAFIVGSKIGELLHLEERMSNLGKSSNASYNAILDSFLYFGIGGLQILGPIALTAWVFSSFFTERIIMEVCAMGFIILFFSGFNLVSNSKYKISNLNMLPSVFLMLIISGIKEWLF